MNQQERSVSDPGLLESIRRLGREDPQGLRCLLEQIFSDANLGLSSEVLTLARTLGYDDVELLEAVDSGGVVRTFGFLRHEAERRRRETTLTPVM